MTKYLFSIILACGLIIQTGCLQNSNETKSCYSDNLSGKEKVFTKMLDKPHFAGGHDSLVSFLSANINFEKFTGGFFWDEKTYSDTARIKFIVNKQGGISALSIETTKKKRFADEVTRVIKKSSCNWVAGGSGELVNGWHRFDIYYSIEKPSENELKTTMTVNEL
ncbi:hypothetical protein [Segetibacter aerophilus]|uniref:Uncharacterized protein n=1 Tax=Segetibacter aerophilus TaxID=670293 RepID=A0A512BBA6_9BACT|nr:hypothetical protein [Segetibacter aerophilus]GEO09252.1 hypothetical protein SAE01_17480 [Segetibacter aerophilus]